MTYPDHIQRLIDACRRYRGRDPRDVLDAISEPEWDDASSFGDWRNHVPAVVKDCWDALPLEARLAAYLPAALSAKSDR